MMKIINSLSEISCIQSNFPIFFWDKWLEYEKNSNCKVFLYFDEKYKAVLPFKVHTLKFLKKADYIYVPLDIFGHILDSEIEKYFINNFHEFLKTSNTCDVIFPPQHICNFKSLPQKVLFFKLGIIYIDLLNSESDIFDRMSSSYRNKIRKAIKTNVITQFDNNLLSDFYSLYNETHLKQKMKPEPIKKFEEIIKTIPSNVQIGVAKLDESLESAVFNVFDGVNSYYLYGGTSHNTLMPGSNKLLFWETIKINKELGIGKFILGGYRNPKGTDNKHNGIQEFKLRFGAQIEEGFHFIKIINPLKYHLFMLALKIKSIITGKNLGFINKTGLEIKRSK